MGNDLENSILRTAAYFSYFSYPLTAFELWKWLLGPTVPYSYLEVVQALATSEILQRRLARESGFYCLANEDGPSPITAQLEDRSSRLVDALQKYGVIARYLSYLAHVPAVRGVAICNSLAFHHTNSASDIDLFIITKPGLTWTARFLSALPLILLRRRPGEAKQNPICLSFFAAQTALALEGVKISEQDPYLAYWSMTLMPIFDRSLWHRQLADQNRWVHEYLPNAYYVRRAQAFRASPSRFNLPTFFSEKLLKKVQEDRLPRHMKAMGNLDTRVILRDDMLKFHDQDRREEIKLALEERLTTLV